MSNLDRIKKEIETIRANHKPLTEYAADDLQQILIYFSSRDYLLVGARVSWDDEFNMLCIVRKATNVGWAIMFDSDEDDEFCHDKESGGNYWIKDIATGLGSNTRNMIEPIDRFFKEGGKYIDEE